MGGVLDDLTRAIDALVAHAPHDLADGETQVELQRQLARLDGVTTRSAAAFDASGEWADDGAMSATAWLAASCRLPKATALRRVKLGRALRTMPATEAAWLSGALTAEQVHVLTNAHDDSPVAFGADEDELVRCATGAGWRGFCRKVSYWRQVHEPDLVEDDAARVLANRDAHLSQSFDDQWFLDGTFDPIGGSVLHDTWRRIEHELFERDWSEAKRRLDREPAVGELRRTAAQRRADAFVEMAVRARTAPKDGRRPEPLFTVYVNYETFAGRLCQLANGTVVTPGSLVPYLSDAWVERVVFGPRSRVIDVGQQRRLFTGADRRAVMTRDLAECFHDTCDETGEHLQIDHVEPCAVGGATIQDNGRVACPTHNRRRNRRRRPPGTGPRRGP